MRQKMILKMIKYWIIVHNWILLCIYREPSVWARYISELSHFIIVATWSLTSILNIFILFKLHHCWRVGVVSLPSDHGRVRLQKLFCKAYCISLSWFHAHIVLICCRFISIVYSLKSFLSLRDYDGIFIRHRSWWIFVIRLSTYKNIILKCHRPTCILNWNHSRLWSIIMRQRLLWFLFCGINDHLLSTMSR